jgi:hypothetical protein
MYWNLESTNLTRPSLRLSSAGSFTFQLSQSQYNLLTNQFVNKIDVFIAMNEGKYRG